MKTSINKRPTALAILGFLAVIWAVSACDEDGDLNTVVEQESLAEYMEVHTELRLYLNAVSNYREPLYICMYDGDSLLTPMPLGKYGSEAGIPYGEITAVEVTNVYAGLDGTENVFDVFVTDGLSPCAETPSEGGLVFTMGGLGEDDASMIRIISGLIPSSEGGEEWMVCGDNGDSACAEESHLINAGTGLQPNSPIDASKTTVTFWKIGDELAADDATYTFCWNDGNGNMSALGPYPIPYEPPYRGWFDVDPLLSGAVMLFDGDVDCTAADPSAALTSTPIPADATFGPDGSTVKFEAGSSGTFVVIGQSASGIPAEAGLKIIPILHWFE